MDTQAYLYGQLPKFMDYEHFVSIEYGTMALWPLLQALWERSKGGCPCGNGK